MELNGLYFIFSCCVMRALGKLDEVAGARAMNQINAVIMNPWFMSVFMGCPAICVGLLVNLYFERPSGPAFSLQLVGSLLLLLGEFIVTAAMNVPLNNDLAKVEKEKGAVAAGAFFTDHYAGPWTAWNTIRCVASIGTVLCFSAALKLK